METKLPNILVTGTPGTGKTVFSDAAAERSGLRRVDVTQLVRQHGCHEGRDESFDTLILDEDKLLDVMEPIMASGGNIVDYHSCEFFPERWFDLVLVLQADTEILFDRLTERGYSKKKIDENMECEIMRVVAESASESYDAEIVYFLDSNNIDDMEANVERLMAWFGNWKKNNRILT